jgi:adenine-specific DNA-methyltransferase
MKQLHFFTNSLDERGMIYVHLDWHVSFYAKTMRDDIFGSDNFVNEIVWKRQTAKGDVTQGAVHMGRIHDSIFVYAKSDSYTWNMQYVPYDEKYLVPPSGSRDSALREGTKVV